MNENKKVALISGVKLSHIKLVSDLRGSFFKFHPTEGLENPLDSIAISVNPHKGTIRGFHFQVEPFAEEKLISCIQGAIFDVIVDIRKASSTFGKWMSCELTANNALQAYLPKGVAHGFQTLLPNTIVHYGISSSYSPESAYCINPLDNLGVNWPLQPGPMSDNDIEGLTFELAAKKFAESLQQ